jgi:hypothetical protein
VASQWWKVVLSSYKVVMVMGMYLKPGYVDSQGMKDELSYEVVIRNY